MAQFVAITEQGDNSVHHVNLDHLVQVVHVPNSPLATVSTSDGKSFRISQDDLQKLLPLITATRGGASR